MKAARIALIAVAQSPALAFAQQIQVPFATPALDEVGLFALISLVGAVGAYFARRNRK